MTDFEGALKFFRVPVPKRYRSEENAKKLMELACSMKVKPVVRIAVRKARWGRADNVWLPGEALYLLFKYAGLDINIEI